MKSLKWLGIAAGIAALAACGSADDANVTNDDELNAMAADNMILPPIDMNADMNATTNDVANDVNTTDNTANTTVNGY